MTHTRCEMGFGQKDASSDTGEGFAEARSGMHSLLDHFLACKY